MRSMFLGIGASALLLSGCINQHVAIEPPRSLTINNERDVDLPFEDVWKNIVKNASTTFFVINNVEKDSKIINISFNKDNPIEFLDCGIKYLTINDRNYDIPLAGNAIYPAVFKKEFVKIEGVEHRYTSVIGRANIFVEPVSATTSRVTVNVLYNFKARTIATQEAQNLRRTNEYSVNFNTGRPGSSGELLCRSTGELEKGLLDLAEGA